MEVDLRLLDEMGEYVHDPEGHKKPVPNEYMDLDMDGDDSFDEGDLEAAKEAYWSETAVGGAGYVWRYYHKDHLGGSTMVTDGTGKVVSSMQYRPYGDVAYRSGVAPVYGFAGGEIEEEEELGLIRFGARWYAPEVGRWVSGDLLFVESPTKSAERTLESGLYSYSANNPVNFRDPAGTETYTDEEIDSALQTSTDDFGADQSLEQALDSATPKDSGADFDTWFQKETSTGLEPAEGYLFPIKGQPDLPYSKEGSLQYSKEHNQKNPGTRWFGAERGSGSHPGSDLVVSEGTPVYAMASGKVKYRSEGFTKGQRNDTGADYSTCAVMVDDGTNTVLYGEIKTDLKPGMTVKQGEQIGTVMRQEKNSMLHIEMYSNKDKGHPLKGSDKSLEKFPNRRPDIIDPTVFLDNATVTH